MGFGTVVVGASAAFGGPFAPGAGRPGTTAVGLGDSRIRAWPSSVVSLVRGPVDVADPGGELATFGSVSTLTRAFSGDVFDVVSLGDGGSVTVRFEVPIREGEGPDFAVFENGFAVGSSGLGFLELAYVDVSSDGVHFVRFPSQSVTPADVEEDQLGAFDTVDPTDVHNLAGKYTLGFGTPFDLADVVGVSAYLDVLNVHYVRVTDVVGNIVPIGGQGPSLDSVGYPINDPYSTPFSTGGFDLGGVAALYVNTVIPEAGAGWVLGAVLSAMVARRRRGV